MAVPVNYEFVLVRGIIRTMTVIIAVTNMHCKKFHMIKQLRYKYRYLYNIHCIYSHVHVHVHVMLVTSYSLKTMHYAGR